MSDATLEFWKSMALGLKDEWAKRGDEIDSLRAENERLRTGMGKELNDVEQALGAALGYPRYCDDLDNFPGSTEANGVCIGVHSAASIAMEAASRIDSLRAQLAEHAKTIYSRDKLIGQLSEQLAEAQAGPWEDVPEGLYEVAPLKAIRVLPGRIHLLTHPGDPEKGISIGAPMPTDWRLQRRLTPAEAVDDAPVQGEGVA